MRSSIFLSALLVVLIGSAFSASRKSEYPSLLWQIQSERGELEGYLLGTMHSGDSGVYAQLEKISPFLKQCSVYSGELDFDDLTQVSALGEINLFMQDTTIALLYDSVEYQRVSAFLVDQLGPQSMMMETMKPFWISATLTMQSESGEAGELGQVLDVALQEHAESMGLELKPLETVASQMASIDAIPLDVQAEMLLDLVDGYGQQVELMNTLPELYASQDLQKLYEMYSEEAFPGDMHSALVTKRNVSMTDSLVDLLETHDPVFCGVGALHLPGPDGMIELLRERGYQVTPIALD